MLFSHNYLFEREIGDGTGALGFDRRMTMTNADGGKTEYYFDATNQRSWKVNPEDWTSDNSNPSVPKTYSAIDPDPNNKARIGDTWNTDDEQTQWDNRPLIKKMAIQVFILQFYHRCTCKNEMKFIYKVMIAACILFLCPGCGYLRKFSNHQKNTVAHIIDTWFNPPRMDEFEDKIAYKDVDYCVVGQHQEKRAVSLLEKDSIISLSENDLHEYCSSANPIKPRKGLTPFLVRALSSVEWQHEQYSVRYSPDENILWIKCLFAFKEAPWEATTNRRVYRRAIVTFLPRKPDRILVTINEGIYE